MPRGHRIIQQHQPNSLLYLLLKMQHATDALLKFRDERNWKQFHDPKNLAAALGIEAAELNEVFLWKTTEESRDVELAKVKEELADGKPDDETLLYDETVDKFNATGCKTIRDHSKQPEYGSEE